MINVLRLAALAALCCAFASQAAAPSDPLEGLWVGQMHWNAGPAGTLALAHRGSAWTATLAGNHMAFTAQGSEIRFAFAGNNGSFRGSRDGDNIRGFWIQPHAGGGDPRDPDGKGQTFASSVTFVRGTDGAWRGEIQPQVDSFTLYLKVFRDDNGALIGAFRNPEMNFRFGASQMLVSRSGNTVSFTDPSDAKSVFQANLAPSPDQLQMKLPRVGVNMILARATAQQAARFYLRSAGDTPYTYREPDDVHDGWSVARAGDTGLDEIALTQLVRSIIATDPAAKRPSLIHSLLIAHRGKLVLEEYFGGFDRDTPHDTRSASKTFSSVMLGALILRGTAISPDTKIYPLVSAMGPFANPDPRKDDITLAELMTHTSGLACDDNDDDSPGNEEAVQSQRQNPDWWKYTLDLAVVHDPGTRYAYCSPGINLVGAALATASHEWLPQLFDETVARPLQWSRYYWDLMPNDEGYLGGGVFVRPRDVLKLGQTYLNGGVWNGRRIVSAAWAKESTALHAEISPQTTGLPESDFHNFYFPGEDGFAWHLTTLHTPSRDYRAYGASGNGGQLLVVVPELDLVVGFTGGNYGQGLIWNGWRDHMIPDAIIPALR
ncbi:MAG TPA: serine hydrolase [Rhizomicrobium sp.]|nr:serine hydrolase [Rhizomicrobium sp.]